MGSEWLEQKLLLSGASAGLFTSLKASLLY